MTQSWHSNTSVALGADDALKRKGTDGGGAAKAEKRRVRNEQWQECIVRVRVANASIADNEGGGQDTHPKFWFAEFFTSANEMLEAPVPPDKLYGWDHQNNDLTC